MRERIKSGNDFKLRFTWSRTYIIIIFKSAAIWHSVIFFLFVIIMSKLNWHISFRLMSQSWLLNYSRSLPLIPLKSGGGIEARGGEDRNLHFKKKKKKKKKEKKKHQMKLQDASAGSYLIGFEYLEGANPRPTTPPRLSLSRRKQTGGQRKYLACLKAVALMAGR